MKYKIRNIGFVIGLCSLIFVGCEDNLDPIVEKLDFSRVFTPINLTARIRNMTTVELNWDLRDDADSYVVEISEDSLEFSSIIKTVNVARNEVPVSITLDGQTQYSARVKGVSDSGIDDSKWTMIAFKTDAENIFETLDPENIKATSVTLNWLAGSDVTNFIINPGNTDRPITDQEKADGEATITGLTGETEYTITLNNGAKQRGEVAFTTPVDIGDATPVHAEDDLNAAIAAAQDGDVLALFPGDYLAYVGEIAINKSISLKAVRPYDKPILHVQFDLEDGAQDVEMGDLEMDGIYTDPSTSTDVTLDYAFNYNSSAGTFGNLEIKGCIISNYGKSLVSGSSGDFMAESVLIDDCVVSNVCQGGGDFIDFRTSYLANLTVTNSTFSNCANAPRDFIRMDGDSKGNTFDNGTNMPVIEVSNCTLYNVMNSTSSTKRFFYVRWSQNEITSKNNNFVEMGNSVYSNQSATSQADCSTNNYFHADGYFDNTVEVFDNSANYTTLDPGFADTDNGDFTISNQTLMDNNVGDPRWLP